MVGFAFGSLSKFGRSNLVASFCKMSSMKTLIGIDFDHTLLDANSDTQLKRLIPDFSLPENVVQLSRTKDGWTAYMREIFIHLYKNGIRRKDYENCLSSMSLMPGMKELLVKTYESGNYDTIIISDANSFFIDYILGQHSLKHTVKKVFTNPSSFDDSGCLRIQEYEVQNWCNQCARNICKGSVLRSFIAEQGGEGEVYGRVVYIGDGTNDVCPALKLGCGDLIFARNNFPMLKKLRKLPEDSIKGKVIRWERGNDITNVLFDSAS